MYTFHTVNTRKTMLKISFSTEAIVIQKIFDFRVFTVKKIPYFEGLNIILKTFLLFGSKKGKEGRDGV